MSRNRRRETRSFISGAEVKAASSPFSVEDATVQAQKLGPRSQKTIGGPLLDISSRGMRFITSETLPTGTTLRIRVSFNTIARPLETEGVIRWAHPHDAPGSYSLGVEFDDLDSAGQKTLKQVRAHEKSKTRGPRTALRHKEALAGGLVPLPMPAAKPPAPKRASRGTPDGPGPQGGPRRIAILATLLGLSVVASVTVAWWFAETRENYHRFGHGSRWVYAVRAEDEESVVHRTVVEDRPGARMTVETGPPPEDDEVPLKTTRSDWFVEGSYLVYYSPSKRPYRVYRFGSHEGDRWLTRPGSIPEVRTTHEGIQSLTVKAGTFENALRVRFTTFEKSTEENTLYLVPEVGVVLWEVAVKSATRTSVRRQELSEYTIVPTPAP